jgi:hypothetical protein
MGPPIRLARIRPKVALAMPISMALVMPYCSAMVGAQAMVVPWPPISDTVPPTTPTAAGQVEQRRHRDAGHVLREHEADGDQQQDDEGPPAGQQVRGTRR